jgi:hypothetical protein
LIDAEKAGLTFEKPYIIKDGIVYGAMSAGIEPMF